MAEILLAIDTASPIVSVAAGARGEPACSRQIPLECSSERLLHTIDAVLAEVGCALTQLAGIAVLCGPGSFTGLRVGLATVLGFHQALGLRVTVLPTLPVLARAVAVTPERVVVAAVDALRGDWYVQVFRAGFRPDEPRLAPAGALSQLAPCTIIGFGVTRLCAELGPVPDLALIEPPPLAPLALELAADPATEWDPARLTRPIYFRPPAVTGTPVVPAPFAP